MVITTERLCLKPVSEAHIDSIYRYFTPEVTTYMYPSVAKNKNETRAVVNHFIEQHKQHSDYVFAIIQKNNQEFIGLVGLHQLKSKIPELGIWTKLEAHGNHYGREAIGGMIAYASGLGIKKLCYPVDRRNIASRKIPLFYGGKLVENYKEVKTPDGRILEEEIYEITIAE